MLAHRRLDVLPDRQAGKQRSLLEKDAPALPDQEPVLRTELVDVVAEDLDRARLLGNEAEDGSGQDRFACAGSADEAKHFAAIEIEIESVHDEAIPEPDLEAADPDDGLAQFIKGRWSARVQ